jgi:hypothetical protein
VTDLRLPPQLEVLKFCDGFHEPVNSLKLPASLRELRFGGDYLHASDVKLFIWFALPLISRRVMYLWCALVTPIDRSRLSTPVTAAVAISDPCRSIQMAVRVASRLVSP